MNKSKTSSKKLWAGILPLVILGGLLFWYTRPQPEPWDAQAQQTLVAVEKLALTQKPVTVQLRGQAQAMHSAQITAGTAGKVQQVLAKKGYKVAQNQALATIYNPALQTKQQEQAANLAKAQADLALATTQAQINQRTLEADLVQAQERLTQARHQLNEKELTLKNLAKELEVNKFLYEQDALAKVELDRTELSYNSSVEQVAQQRASVTIAQEQVAVASSKLTNKNGDALRIQSSAAQAQAAQASLREARSQLGELTVTSPIAGVIVQEDITLGQQVSESDVLFTVQQSQQLHIETAIPEQYMSHLKPGLEVTVYPENQPNSSKKSVIRQLIPNIQQNSSGFTCVLAVDNRDHAWVPGIFVQGLIPLQEAEGYLINKSTVTASDQGELQVFQAEKTDNGYEAKACSINVLWESDTKYLVSPEGFDSNLPLITTNISVLYPGQTITLESQP